MSVIDVTEASFQAEVLDRSTGEVVAVDFWAGWCAPCHALAPLLERSADAHGVVLTKVEADVHRNVTRHFGVTVLPTVKAFRKREVVSELRGAKLPADVDRFFAGLALGEVDDLLAFGDEASLRRALALAPGRADVAVALARCLPRLDALELLATYSGSYRAAALAARLRLEAVGSCRDAFEALDAGELDLAVDLLLDWLPVVDGQRSDVRDVIVAGLNEAGVNHPLARVWRRRLAAGLQESQQ